MTLGGVCDAVAGDVSVTTVEWNGGLPVHRRGWASGSRRRLRGWACLAGPVAPVARTGLRRVGAGHPLDRAGPRGWGGRTGRERERDSTVAARIGRRGRWAGVRARKVGDAALDPFVQHRKVTDARMGKLRIERARRRHVLHDRDAVIDQRTVGIAGENVDPPRVGRRRRHVGERMIVTDAPEVSNGACPMARVAIGFQDLLRLRAGYGTARVGQVRGVADGERLVRRRGRVRLGRRAQNAKPAA
jgi:hypothetical protein